MDGCGVADLKLLEKDTRSRPSVLFALFGWAASPGALAPLCGRGTSLEQKKHVRCVLSLASPCPEQPNFPNPRLAACQKKKSWK